MLEIELPITLVDDLSAQATQIVADLAPIWLLVGGILLGFGVIAFVVGLLSTSKEAGDMLEVDTDGELP